MNVAVIVRTKNRPMFLARAFSSLASQTSSDFTVVVVNDGGDPMAVDELVAHSDLAERCVVVHHTESVGRPAAINVGLDAAAGAEAFAIHDDDDTWAPEFLAATTEWLADHPTAVAVATRTEVVSEELQDDRIVELARTVLAKDLDTVTLGQTALQNYVPPIAMLIRTSVLGEIGRFDPDLPVLEDWEFNLRLLSKGAVGFLPDRPLAFWHHRRGAVGAAENSIVAEARDHERYDGVIRDDYLRRDLAGDGNGLGLHLATARMVRTMTEGSDEQWRVHSGVVDAFNVSHERHLEAGFSGLNSHVGEVAKVLSIEIARLRGEGIALRELVIKLREEVGSSKTELRRQIREDAKPVRQGLRRMSRRVDDLWQADKAVARMVRKRRTPPR